MVKDEKEFPVVYVGKFDGIMSHEVSGGGLTVGDKVACKIDWERRYLHAIPYGMPCAKCCYT